MSALPYLLAGATILPLVSFFAILIFGNKMQSKTSSLTATGAILAAGILSFSSLGIWLFNHWPEGSHGGGHATAGAEHKDEKHEGGKEDGHKENKKDEHKEGDGEHKEDKKGEHKEDKEGEHKQGDAEHKEGEHKEGEHHGHAHAHVAPPPAYISDDYYTLGVFGDLRLSISYYIDSLTICMFCMVTLIATCIHFYAQGYMHDEEHDYTDHEVTMSDGSHLTRPGRYHRFFQSLSLFCFSMLGLVLAGNIAMVFVFWELVGICSYFLIGFYVERKSASTAANKAFIVNRVGDFGMIIGLMALWASLGTFAFGDYKDAEGHVTEKGIFSLVRAGEDHQIETPDGMVLLAAKDEINKAVTEKATGLETVEERAELIHAEIAAIKNDDPESESARPGYWLLIIAGVGIFCGCVGKSAQFPLHVWLPDAMEGPTPVSALVHSATMVAAGVYLVGRFYPVFVPEVLLVIAVCGVITLFMAATIAITATDIKRVLAYSTISQLGYMMMALGVGGWLAGLMHLVTHAFFKSLLFMCSGSVIHAVHTNEMPQMGGLWKKMPYTAFTMLVGCLAISGASVPFVIGLSGYYSKDAILEQAWWFMKQNDSGLASVFFFAAMASAAITAFYMFRLWFMTFVGKPRDEHRYDHAHESPKVMYVPLLILSVFAISVAWDIRDGLLIVLGIAAAFLTYYVLGFLLYLIWNIGVSGFSKPRCITGIVFGCLVFFLFRLLVPLEFLPGHTLTLMNLLDASRPAGLGEMQGLWINNVWPNEHDIHDHSLLWQIKVPVTLMAFGTAVLGITLAACFYWFRVLDAAETRKAFQPIYRLLWNKWYFDELYDFLFVRPSHVIARCVAGFDRRWIDWVIDGSAKVTRAFAVLWDAVADRRIVDGSVNLLARCTQAIGNSLRVIQTGRIRQYVMFIVVGSLLLFIVISYGRSFL